jgi:thioester reductase-like protein
VTLIIHNAWRLDFNLRLSSFESHVQGVRKLIDFSASSPLENPPRIFFTSSVSTVAGFKDGFVPETFLQDPEIGVGTGYGESKWVSDQVRLVR